VAVLVTTISAFGTRAPLDVWDLSFEGRCGFAMARGEERDGKRNIERNGERRRDVIST